jgi:hypothetical protein
LWTKDAIPGNWTEIDRVWSGKSLRMPQGHNRREHVDTQFIPPVNYRRKPALYNRPMLRDRPLIRRIRCALCLALSLVPLAAQPARIGSIRRLDPAVDKIVPPEAAIEKVAGDLQFAEGPIWVRNGGYLLFSDIPANAIMKWIPSG